MKGMASEETSIRYLVVEESGVFAGRLRMHMQEAYRSGQVRMTVIFI